MNDTLGVLAHRGGLVVERPELSVGVVQAVSRPSGVEIELLARRPLDRRTATERQADIRAGRGGPPTAPRRLLPAFDEGTDLRVGWLDPDGHPHWEYGSGSSSGGDHFEGTSGPSLRTVVRLPPLFDRVSVVLAWPEIGFPETTVDWLLPDRVTVERDTVSVWRAPVDSMAAPDSLNHRVDPLGYGEPAVEAGRVVAGPRVLSRSDDSAVVLTRLTAIGSDLSMELSSLARDETARAMAFPSWPAATDDEIERIRRCGTGASAAVIRGGDAFWIRPGDGSSSGGGYDFRCTEEFALGRPGDGVLDLLVGWPEAGLGDVRVSIPLDQV